MIASSSPTLAIGVDASEANVVNRVGSNVYAFEILKQLEMITRQQPVRWTVFLSAEPVSDLPAERDGWQYQLLKPGAFATQIALPLTLFAKRREFNVFFTPGHYAPRWCPIPYANCVMDLAFEYFPEQFRTKDLYQLRNWTEYSVKNAAHVFAISEATKRDVIEHYRLTPEQVSVAYPALSIANQENIPDQRLLNKWGLKSPYLLYVGTLQPRKNLIRAIQAFEKLKQNSNFETVKLVLAGKVGWLAEEIQQTAQQSPFTQDIIFTGYVTELEKTVLMKHAAATFLVGLYEGFGMPPLESLAVGTVPIVSHSSSLPEVVGEAGILVDPTSVDSIADGFRYALQLKSSVKADFQHKATQQLKKFSWEKSAQLILNKLKALA